MKVVEFAAGSSCSAVSLPDPDREISGVYAGDLLSWVMGNAKEDNLWITIMTNANVIAVASLVGVSAIILAEGVALDKQTAALAKEKEINVLASDKSVYELCLIAGGLL